MLTHVKNLLCAEHFAVLWHASAGAERNGKFGKESEKLVAVITDNFQDERLHQISWSDRHLVPRKSCMMGNLQSSGTPPSAGGISNILQGFSTGLAFLARGTFTFAQMNWILIKVFFGSSYLGFVSQRSG
jgi:hypothetical protein